MTYTANPMPGYKALVNIASVTTSGTDLALTNGGDDKTFTVPLADAHRYLDRAVAPVVQVENDEIQTVTITGSPTGGTFTLSFGGGTTSPIAYNASAATVQADLAALAFIGTGNVSVTGSAGGPWTVEFIGSLADAPQSLMTANSSGLTGGASPTATPARTQAGSAWATIAASTYTLRNLTAQVLLNVALLGINVNCRLHTYSYYPYVSIAQATDITFTGTTHMLDTTVMQGASGAGFTSCIPGLTSGVFACKSWQLATGATIYTAYLTGRTLIILSFVDPNGTDAIEAYVYCSDSNIQSSLTTVSAEDLTFTCDSVIALI